jgi:seryl-tRNA synthetase
MRLIVSPFFHVLMGLAVVVCLGCGSSVSQSDKVTASVPSPQDHEHDHADEHGDHDEHASAPTTYAEAVTQVESLRTELRESLAKEDIKQADEAVHEVGHVLEKIPDLSKEASLSAEAEEEIKNDVNTLFDQFGKIDELIHAEKPVDYNEYSEKIDGAIERLRAHVAK